MATDFQANRLNPTAANLKLPTNGSIFVDGRGDYPTAVYYRSPDGSLKTMDIQGLAEQVFPGSTQLGGQFNYSGGAQQATKQAFKQLFGVDLSSIPKYQGSDLGSLLQSATKLDPNNFKSLLSQGTPTLQTENVPVNTSPNKLADKLPLSPAGAPQTMTDRKFSNPKVLTPTQQKAYYASQTNSPTPLSPEQWLQQQGTSTQNTPANTGTSRQLQGIYDQAQAISGQIPSATGFSDQNPPSNQMSAGTSIPPQGTTLQDQVDQYLQKIYGSGMIVNPNISITPDQIAQFAQQAANEIHPYYADQLKTATEDFTKQQGLQSQQYGRDLSSLGSQEANKGFAQSGERNVNEGLLTQGYQNTAGTAARSFAGQFGGGAVPSSPTLNTPQGTQPLYSLSDSVYSGLQGTNTFQERADTQSRADQLQAAFRGQQATPQPRTITL